MPFLEEIEDVTGKLPGRHVARPVLVGIVGIVIAVALLALAGAASTARGDLTVDTAAPSPSAASIESGEEPAGDAGTCFVYIVGAVADPGVYELSADARVNEAVEAAGGFTKKADRAAVNLARPVVDGEQILIPEEGEAATGGAAGEAQGASSAGVPAAGGGITPDGKVNINTATAAELQALPGVGEATAAKIVASREAEGPFSAPDDLKRVSGIGDKKFEAMADMVTV